MKAPFYLSAILLIACSCSNSESKTPAKKLLHEKELTTEEKYQLDQLNKIETASTYLIYEIDRLKIDLLKKAGEKHPSEDFLPSTIPIRYDLSKLKNPINREATNQLFISQDGNNPSKTGKLLFDDFRTLRKELLKIALSTENHSVTIREFNDYSSEEELQKLLEKEIALKDIATHIDKQLIIDLYRELSLPDYKDLNGKKVHWIIYTFKDWEITTAIATLTSMQSNILKARYISIEILKSKIPAKK